MSEREFAEDASDDLADAGPSAVEQEAERGYTDWIAAQSPERRALLRINHQALQDEFVTATGKFAWWFESYADAEDAWLRAKAAVKLARAQSLLAVILDAKKKPSREVIDAMVDADPDVLEAEEKEHQTRRKYRRWQGDIEALRQRRDYLVQLGARGRAEMIQEPKINEQEQSKTERRRR